RDAPDLPELERHSRRDLVDDGVVLPAPDDLVQPGADRVGPAERRLGVELGNARQALRRVREPRPAREVVVQVVVAVGEDVEPGELLVVEDGADGVDELLAVRHVGHTRRERALVEVAREPGGARPRARDGGWKDPVFGCCEHVTPFARPDELSDYPLSADSSRIGANGAGQAAIFGIEKRAIVPNCGAGLQAWATPA